MNREQKVLVVGASGLVGAAVAVNLVGSGTNFIAVSRNPPTAIDRDRFVSLNLLDAAQCRVPGEIEGTPHLVYIALDEQSKLVSSWSDKQQIEVDNQMFKNVLDSLNQPKTDLQHVSLLQGTKAYGAHVRAIPARENRDELKPQANF